VVDSRHLEKLKDSHISNDLTNRRKIWQGEPCRCEIWHYDARLPCELHWQLIPENLRWQKAAILMAAKWPISQQNFVSNVYMATPIDVVVFECCKKF